MENVIIPEGFFLAEAKKEYYDYQARLIQEVIQNSYDAGATEIRLNFGENNYSIEDNGHGMSRQRMVDALLTFGGSWKQDSNCTGSFGKAKFLILQAHKNYIIHSLDTYVSGQILQYQFVEGKGYQNGTKIVCEFCNAFDYNKEKMISKAKDILATFNLNSKVFINGEQFTNWKVLPFCRDYNWCKLYAAKENESYKNYVHVRKNGLWMFSEYVSDLNRDVYIEVEGSSSELFTQNRDGFTGEYRKKFSALIGEINIDKKSFLRGNKIALTIYRGKERFWRGVVNKILKEINEAIPVSEVKTLQTFSEAEVVAFFNSRVDSSNLNKVIDIIEGAKKNIPVDFVVDLSNSDYFTCPTQYDVDFMLQKNRFLANLWKNTLLLISKITETNEDFRIGWCFDKEKLACYNRKDGENSFLINPECEKFSQRKNIKELVYNVISTACHEWVHLTYNYHDENFAGALTDLTAKVFAEASWRELVNVSRCDTVFCVA